MKNRKLSQADFQRLREILESNPTLKELVDSAIAESTHRRRRRLPEPYIPKRPGIEDCWLSNRDVRIRYAHQRSANPSF